ncbi:MAG: ACT domain-containing protein [Gemmatimonadales bacterium]
MPLTLTLDLLSEPLAICRLRPDAPVPSWAMAPSAFLTITRTAEELSITTAARLVPPGITTVPGYRALKVRGPLAFDVVGVLAAFTAPLAAAGLPILTISTHDTDYVLIREGDLAPAAAALEAVGHHVVRSGP